VSDARLDLQHSRTRTISSQSRRPKPPSKEKLQPDAKLLVSREEAAQMLSISVRGVDYLIATKRLSTRRVGTRVLIPIEGVRRFARSDHPERLAG
jgi:excisionase family DNA binding protein